MLSAAQHPLQELSMDELTHIRHAANCTCSNVVGDLQQPWQSILFHCEWYRQLSVGGRGSRLIRLHCSCCAPLRLLFLWFNEALSYGPAQSAGRPRGGRTDLEPQIRSVVKHFACAAASAHKQWVLHAIEEADRCAPGSCVAALCFRCRCRAQISLQIKIAEV